MGPSGRLRGDQRRHPRAGRPADGRGLGRAARREGPGRRRLPRAADHRRAARATRRSCSSWPSEHKDVVLDESPSAHRRTFTIRELAHALEDIGERHDWPTLLAAAGAEDVVSRWTALPALVAAHRRRIAARGPRRRRPLQARCERVRPDGRRGRPRRARASCSGSVSSRAERACAPTRRTRHPSAAARTPAPRRARVPRRPWRRAAGSMPSGRVRPSSRVERVDAVLAGRVVGRGAQVHRRRAVLERAEGVAQALGEVDRPAVDGVEDARTPTGRRSASRPGCRRRSRRGSRVSAVTYLPWPGGTSAKWMPRTVPRAETETLVWTMSGRWPRCSASRSPRKDSRKTPAVVRELARGDHVGAARSTGARSASAPGPPSRQARVDVGAVAGLRERRRRGCGRCSSSIQPARQAISSTQPIL